MSTTLPSDASKANCDASTDDPKLALLTDLATLVDKFNTLKGALGALAQYDISSGGLGTLAQGAGTPDILRVASAVSTKTGVYTVAAADRMKLIRASGTWTLALTAAATLGDGFICFVRNYGSGTITIDPATSETINGAATLPLLPGQSGILICSGSAWSFVGSLTALPDGSTATTQSAGDDSTKLATTAYADAAAPSNRLAAAWVNFNGTGTVAINASYNVSSITDNGTGDYTVNFTTALSHTDYAVAGNALIETTANHTVICLGVYGNRSTGAVNKTTSAVRIVTTPSTTSSSADTADVSVSIFA